MTILAFWEVWNGVERHTLDNVSDVEAFDILWHKRDELNVQFYDLGARLYNDSDWQHGIGSLSDFEDDYNDEYLDGGHWTKVLFIDEEDVKQIIND